MKKATLNILLTILITGTVYAQGVKFEQGDWNSVRTAAKKQHKYIFIDLHTSWCGPCKLLEKDVFPKDTVGRYMNTRFINVSFDTEKGFGIAIAKKYAPNAYPTFIILNSDGRLINRGGGGGSNIKSFLDQIQKLTEQGPDQFAQGISDTININYPVFYNAFFEKNRRPDSATVVGYIRKQKNWLTEVNWNILSLYGAAYLPEYKDWLADNASQIKTLFGVTIDFDRHSLIGELIQKAIAEKDEAGFDKALKQLKNLQKASPSPVLKAQIAVSKLRFYGKTENWDKFFELADSNKKANNNQWDDYTVKIVLDNTNDKKVLEQALDFFKDQNDIDLLSDKSLLLCRLGRWNESAALIGLLKNSGGANEITAALTHITYELGQQSILNNDSTAVCFARKILNQSAIPDKDILIKNLFINYYRSTHQWPEMVSAVDQLIAIDPNTDSRIINDYALYIFYNCNERKSIKKAIVWAKMICNRNQESKDVFIYTYAALLYKDNQKQEAIDNLNNILSNARGKVENTDTASDLLEKIKGSR